MRAGTRRWDEMMAAFRRDVNKDHFERDAQFDAEVKRFPRTCTRSFSTS